MTELLKAVHIPSMLLWVGGLLYLPWLLVAHRYAAHATDFIRVRRASRFAHNAVVAPAGVVAIGSGTALLFVSPGVLDGWMYAKLALVWVLVAANMQVGHVLRMLSEHGREPPAGRIAVTASAIVLSSGAILWLVLGQPHLPAEELLPDWLLEPGRIQSLSSWVVGSSLATPIPLSKTS